MVSFLKITENHEKLAEKWIYIAKFPFQDPDPDSE